VKRFSRFHRGTHLLIIVSFLTLAATGLPLKFHFTDWAQALASLPFFIEIAHVLHRIAAVITFGYAFAHLGFIVKRSILDKKSGLLYGWRSMVPRPKDLFDLLGNLRWFLYLGPRPKFDRWTYWEKFDYFAVFWGIPIIGVSGLMLWFPELFTAILPGWALNAAWVVHSDEALLATGFIFVFHFFHTHLRPEIFPFDPVIFTGSMPLSRFREERRLEYERLQASGELAGRLVKAPGEKRLQVLFGRAIVAVTVGVLLAVAIFWSLFHY
jgi:cytochrome b subunit of formate dehydrogenase